MNLSRFCKGLTISFPILVKSHYINQVKCTPTTLAGLVLQHVRVASVTRSHRLATERYRFFACRGTSSLALKKIPSQVFFHARLDEFLLIYSCSRKIHLRALGCIFFAVRRLRSLAQKQPSPVVNKQHFEVVCFPPAHIAMAIWLRA